MYRLAQELHLSPNEILSWKESDFYLWLSVSHDIEKNKNLKQAVLTYFAVWKPQEIPKLFDNKKPMTDDEAVAAIKKAERIQQEVEFQETY